MNFLDLLPDDIIEVINKNLIEAQNNERRKEKERLKRIKREEKRIAKQYKYCEKLLEQAYCKCDNISDFEFCIGGKIVYIKVNLIDSRFNEFETIIISDNFVF